MPSKNYSKLKKIAESALDKKLDSEKQQYSQTDIMRLLEEISIYQSELEAQNEELRHSQQLFERSQRRYANLYDFSPVALVSFNSRGNILELNAATEQLLGYDKSYLINKPFVVFVEPDSKIQFLNHIKRVFETDTPVQAEIKVHNKNGKTFLLQVQSLKGYDTLLKTDFCRSSLTDISYLKEIRCLQDIENKFHSFIANSKDGVFLTDSDGQIQHWNKAMYNITGWPEKEVKEMKLWEVLHHLLPHEERGFFRLSGIEKSLKTFLQHRYSEELERNQLNVILTTKGEEKIVESYFFAMAGETCNCIGGIMRDITQIVKAQDETREQLNFRKILLQTIPVSVYYKELDGVYKGANSAFLDYCNVPQKEIAGKTAFDLWPVHIAETLHQYDLKLLKTGKKQTFEITHRHHDSVETLLFNQTLFTDSQGNTAGIIGTINNITKNKKAEEKILLQYDEIQRKNEEIQGAMAELKATNDALNMTNIELLEISEQLKENEQLYRTLTSNFPNGMVLLFDKNMRYVFADGTLIEHLGFRKNQMIGKTLYDVFPASECKVFEKLYKKVLNGNEQFFEYEHNDIVTQNIIVPIEDNKNRIVYGLAIVQDITQRKRNENQLKESSMLFNTVIESVDEGITLSEPDGYFEIFNSRMIEITGYTKEEANKIDFMQAIYPDEAKFQKASQMLERLRLERSNKNFETTIISKQGKERTLLVSSTLMTYNHKDYYLSTYRDISKRIKAQKEREASEQKFRNFIEQTVDGILLTDAEGRIVEWNKALEFYTSIGRNQVLGSKIWDLEYNELIKPEQQSAEMYDRLKGKFFEQINNEDITNYEIEFYGRDGAVRIFFLSAFLIKIGNEKLLARLARDITERKKAENTLKESEKRLRELNQTKDKFFSIVAHDLKNPFSNIIGLSEMLVNRFNTIDAEKTQRFLRYIYQSSEQGYGLLENLLKWSRSQRGSIEWNPKPINMHNIVQDTILLLQSVAKYKGVEISQTLSENDEVYADADMTLTVIRNLMSNAIKFTHPGGKITVSVVRHGNEMEVTVADTGVGISKENQAKLFRIDVNHSTEGTNEEKGTGLGLILCKEFVEKNGGKIWVESEEGAGAQFKFTLPLTSSELLSSDI